MNLPPAIDLRVRIDEQYVMHHLTMHQEEIRAQVEDGIKLALRDLPQLITDEVAKIAQEATLEAVKRYFMYGDGATDLRNAVSGALRKIIGPDERTEEIHPPRA